MRTRRLFKTLVKDKTTVNVFFVNGIRLRGQLAGFDQSAVLLESGHGVQLVFKPQSASPINPRSPIIFVTWSRAEVLCIGQVGKFVLDGGIGSNSRSTIHVLDGRLLMPPVARRSVYALPKPVTYDEKRSGSKVKD